MSKRIIRRKENYVRTIGPHSFFRHLAAAALVVASIALPAKSSASQLTKQYHRNFSIGGELQAALIVVGWTRDEKKIEQMFDWIVQQANTTYLILTDEISKLSTGNKETLDASPITIQTLENARKLSEWTKGAFDITNYEWRYVKIKKKKKQVQVIRKKMKINIDWIVEGVMADYIIGLVYSANMKNAIVRIGLNFRSIGSAQNGPWKIQVTDLVGTYAHHALNLTLGNVGMSAISSDQYKSKPLTDKWGRPASIKNQGVVVLMKNAEQAQGLARTIFLMDPLKGIALLNSLPNARGLIVDRKGLFLRSTGF